MKHSIVTIDTPNPHYNLALEEHLINALEPDEGALYLWQTQNTVVIGASQNAWAECRCDLLSAEGGALARRTTGGGAVFQDLGNLNFTFIMPAERYDLSRQLGLIIAACKRFGIDAGFTGRNDITACGRKFSGNAFSHKKHRSLQHGTLLVCADFDKMARYLAPPAHKLEAKGIKSVRSRVANLSEFCPQITVSALRDTLSELFCANYENCGLKTAADYDGGAIEMLYKKHSSWDWLYGSAPKFDAKLEKRFEWGGVEILLELAGGRVSSCEVYTDSLDTSLAPRLKAALTGEAYGERLAQSARECAGEDGQMADVAAFLKEGL